MEASVEALAAGLSLELHEPIPGSHNVISVQGIDDPDVVRALGIYLIGLIAGVVAVDMTVNERYLGDGPDYAEQLRHDVAKVLGVSNAIPVGFRDTRRNPWITECVGHVLLMIAGDEAGLCVPGRVWAATVPHDKVTKQGLDLVAVYDDDGEAALCIGESKASHLNAGAHLNSSIRLFREVDARDRDFEIRTTMINSLDAHIPAEIREKVPAMFWQDRRLYMPVIGYSAASSFDPTSERPATFGRLVVSHDRRRCISVALANYYGFFDSVANAMRQAIDAFVVAEEA